MPLDDALRDAAERNGVQQEFWDIFGRRHYTAPETNRAILTALGFDCASEESLRASLAAREEIDKPGRCPPCSLSARTNRCGYRVPERGDFDLEIVTEQGEHHRSGSKTASPDPI